MFDNISRKQFRIDTVFPAIQVASAFVTTQIVGRLGHYTVNSRTTVLLSTVITTIASLAQNFFREKWAYYASLPIGLAASVAVHRFFYPATAFNQVINAKGVVVLLAILASVRLIADNIHRLKRGAEGIEERAERAERAFRQRPDVDAPATV